MRHEEIWESFRALKKYQAMAPPLRSFSNGDSIPLSFSQERLWVLAQLNPGGSEFNVPYAFRVTGNLNVRAMSRTLGEIRRRHVVLRTTFCNVDGKSTQVVQPATDYSIPVADLCEFSPDEKESKVSSMINDEAKRPFDLSNGPLFRSELLKLGEHDHILLITFHHIVFDAWSDGVFFKELDELYDAFSNGKESPLTELDIQYTDFALWQQEWLQSGAPDELLEYWSKNLKDISTQSFPSDFPRLSRPSGILGRKTLLLPKQLRSTLKVLTTEEGMTDFTIFLAAFDVLLHTYLQQDDIYVCAQIANRSRSEVHKLIGYFINFVIYRTDLSGDISFRELLNRACKVSSGVYSHQEMPIQELIGRLGLFDLPLSQIMFSVQNADRHKPKLGGLSVLLLDEQRGVDFDIFLEIEDVPDGLTLNLRYNADLFKSSTMEALADDYQTVLEAAARNPDQPVVAMLPLSDARKSEWRERLKAEAERKANTEISAGDYVAPRDNLELKLTHIWEDLLDRERISVTDNFFELGGKSLIALQMITEIDERLGKALPVSILAELQTIEQIANLLRQDEFFQKSAPIVSLQPRGSNPPLFLLQPAASTTLHFANLARHLAPDQPVYGFEQQGMDGNKPPHQSVEEMAAYYIREMKTVSPDGPYSLMGRCMGGIVAYEMALQLQSQGDAIAFLGILDTQSPPRLEGRDIKYYAVESFNRIMHYIKSGTLLKATVGRFFRKAKRRQSRDVNDRTIQHVMDTHARARRLYVPSKQYHGILRIFKNKEASLAAQSRWANLATQGLDFLETEGSHGTMLDEQHIGDFLRTLKSTIKKSLDCSGQDKREI